MMSAVVTAFTYEDDVESLANIDTNRCLTTRLNRYEIISRTVVEFVCALQTGMLVFNPFSQTVTLVNH